MCQAPWLGLLTALSRVILSPRGQAQWLRYYAYFKDREVQEREFGLLPGAPRSSKSGSQKDLGV